MVNCVKHWPFLYLLLWPLVILTQVLAWLSTETRSAAHLLNSGVLLVVWHFLWGSDSLGHVTKLVRFPFCFSQTHTMLQSSAPSPHTETSRPIQRIVYIDIRGDGKQIVAFLFVLGARYSWNHGNLGQHSDWMLVSINLFLISKQT